MFIRDLPTHGKTMMIHLDVPRLICMACRKTFMAVVAEVDADHSMTERLALLDALQTVHGMVVLSGYPHPLYDEALEGWERREKSARISGGRGTAMRTECVWLNPACARARRTVQLRMI